VGVVIEGRVMESENNDSPRNVADANERESISPLRFNTRFLLNCVQKAAEASPIMPKNPTGKGENSQLENFISKPAT
jgi:hypothetical protein